MENVRRCGDGVGHSGVLPGVACTILQTAGGHRTYGDGDGPGPGGGTAGDVGGGIGEDGGTGDEAGDTANQMIRQYAPNAEAMT